MNIYWKYSIVFVLGLLLGIGSTWLWFTREDVSPQDTSMDTPMEGDGSMVSDDSSLLSGTGGIPTVVEDGVYSVSVADQFPGEVVTLEKVVFAKPGWAAVYEDNNGTPGNILGAARFDAGESAGEIQLLRSTEEGSLYYVILHVDDGDQQFDFKKDSQVYDAEGNRVEATFQTPPHRN